MIERRWSSRQPLRLEIDVECGDNAFSGHTVDVGLGGAFIEAESYKFEQDLDVILRFQPEQDSRIESTDLNARVVRVCDEGIGLMFQNFDADAYRALKTVMSCA
ncbi:MAG: PilZ domain-containing protein [Gammaproteobacteria bacterium]|nr:PilZ domain-containing protein [Gammaproteobacteria bacterium]